ncbi:MAG TPA: DedA family protein [Mycobacteriales bacterium]|jgi:membrane-associated protein|nr:DedA family protein [Mycobacteriales bacterium]
MTLAGASILDATPYINSFGLVGVILIIFAETGLLVGFFLPGDSLLFLAGAFAATHEAGHPHLNIAVLLPGVAIAAVAGGQVGYAIGRAAGPRLFDKPQSRLFKPVYVERTRAVLERYGETKAVLLARVIPVVRTFINPMMGTIRMPMRTFVIANVIGGLVWSLGVTLLGYGLGSSIDIDAYILPITAVVVLLSVIPIALEARKHRRRGTPEPSTAAGSEAAPAPGAVPDVEDPLLPRS